jgi:transposase
MARPKELINEKLVRKAQEALIEKPERKVGVKLQAIISSYRHPNQAVSEVLGVTRQSLSIWIRKFRERGVQGLSDRPKGHAPSKLTQEQWRAVAMWLETSKDAEGGWVAWTMPRLQTEIAIRFGASISLTPLRRQVKNMGFRPKVPRPVHAKADREEQARFKKNRRRSAGNSEP